MKKSDKTELQKIIDSLDVIRGEIQKISENEDPEDGNIEYLEAAINEIGEAIGDIEWTI